MALLARIRSGLVAYAFAFLVVGSLAGTVVLALHSASPFNILGRVLTETKTADSAGLKTTPAVKVPAPAVAARVNEHLSSLVDSGDLPAFNPFTSIDPAMMFVLNAGEGSVYEAPESLLPPIGAFDTSSDAPEYQFARASESGAYGGSSVEGVGGGFSSAGGGITGYGSRGQSVSDSTPAGPGLSIDDFRPERSNPSSGGGSNGGSNGNSSNGSSTNGNGSASNGTPNGNSTSTPAGTGTTNGRVGGPVAPTGTTTPTAGPASGGEGTDGPVSVPEPSSLLLTGAGLVGLANAMRRRSR